MPFFECTPKHQMTSNIPATPEENIGRLFEPGRADSIKNFLSRAETIRNSKPVRWIGALTLTAALTGGAYLKIDNALHTYRQPIPIIHADQPCQAVLLDARLHAPPEQIMSDAATCQQNNSIVNGPNGNSDN